MSDPGYVFANVDEQIEVNYSLTAEILHLRAEYDDDPLHLHKTFEAWLAWRSLEFEAEVGRLHAVIAEAVAESNGVVSAGDPNPQENSEWAQGAVDTASDTLVILAAATTGAEPTPGAVQVSPARPEPQSHPRDVVTPESALAAALGRAERAECVLRAIADCRDDVDGNAIRLADVAAGAAILRAVWAEDEVVRLNAIIAGGLGDSALTLAVTLEGGNR